MCIPTQTNNTSTLTDHTKFMHQQQHNLSQAMQWKCTHSHIIYWLAHGERMGSIDCDEKIYNIRCSAGSCLILLNFAPIFYVLGFKGIPFLSNILNRFPSASAHSMLIFIEVKVKEQYFQLNFKHVQCSSMLNKL